MSSLHTPTGTEVHTWADGFGRWYASVPAGPSAAHVARWAIRDELLLRESQPLGPIVLERARHWEDDPERVVYRELVD